MWHIRLTEYFRFGGHRPTGSGSPASLFGKISGGLAQDVAFFAQFCVFLFLAAGSVRNHSPFGLSHAPL